MRVGRSGNSHPDRGARLSRPRPRRHADRARRGADCRRGTEARPAGCAPRHPPETGGESFRAASLARRTARARRHPQHPQLDRQLAFGARLHGDPGSAADRAHATRVDDHSQPADNALALHARDGAHRDDRRGPAAPARPRQRRAARSDDFGSDRHRPRALRPRRRPGCACAARGATTPESRHRRHAARLERARGVVRDARARSRRLERVEHLHRRRRSVSPPPRRQARGAGYCRHGPFRRPAGRRRTLAPGHGYLRAAVVGRRRGPAGDPAGDGLRDTRCLHDRRRHHRSGRRWLDRPHRAAARRSGARRGAGAAARRSRVAPTSRRGGSRTRRSRLRARPHAGPDGSACSAPWRRSADHVRNRGLLRQAGPVSRADATDDGGAAPARPGCRARALLVGGAAADDRGGAQCAPAHAAVDHRSAARSRPADGERCGRRLDFVQRGSLRLVRAMPKR